MRLLIIALGLLLLMPVFSYSQENKIGVIDLQQVIATSRAGKAAKTQFESEFKQKQQIIESKRAQLERMKNEFIQNGPVMNETTRKQKADQIEQLDKELQRSRADFRDELQKKDFELLEKILKDLDGILQSIGKSEGYTLIIEKTEGGVIFANPTIDITQKVIKAYDAR
ncbi:MAG: OmpH family outer membrane protein [Deltaproteobacteria bacterium]